VPEKDIAIVYTGVRAGEKLEEELFHDLEALAPTAHPALRLAAPRVADLELLARGLDELAAVAEARRRADALRILSRLVPEYRHAGRPAPLAGRA